MSLLTAGIARKFITQEGKEADRRRGGGRARSLGDIFFLNSFAGDYSSAITALTKRETAQNREEGGKVCRRDCLSTFRIGILRRAARDFDKKEEKEEDERKKERRRRSE